MGVESLERLRAETYLISRSEKTSEIYIKSVRFFLRYLDVEDADQYIEEAREGRDVWGDLSRWLSYLDQEKGRARKTIQTYMFGVKKWAEVNRVEVKTPRLKVWGQERDVSPTKQDLRKIYVYGDLFDKSFVTFLVSSGLRVGTALDLNVEDVELDGDGPGAVYVTPEVSKMRVPEYVTFITPEAKRLYKEYLEWRTKRGEEVTPQSPLYVMDKTQPEGFGRLNYGSIAQRWRRILRRTGLDEKSVRNYKRHLHTLRKYARTGMAMAGIPDALVHYMLGHKKYLEASYLRVTPEELKKEYLKAVPYLTIAEETGSIRELEAELEDQRMRFEQSERDKERMESKVQEMEDKIKKQDQLISKLIDLANNNLNHK